MTDTVIGIAALVGLFGLGILCGVLVFPKKETHVKDFVAQCQKSQFYFADGVGIQCPAVINNKETK